MRSVVSGRLSHRLGSVQGISFVLFDFCLRIMNKKYIYIYHYYYYFLQTSSSVASQVSCVNFKLGSFRGDGGDNMTVSGCSWGFSAEIFRGRMVKSSVRPRFRWGAGEAEAEPVTES